MKTFIVIIIVIILAAAAYYYLRSRPASRSSSQAPPPRATAAPRSGPGIIDYATGKYATDQYQRARKNIERVKKMRKPLPEF